MITADPLRATATADPGDLLGYMYHYMFFLGVFVCMLVLCAWYGYE